MKITPQQCELIHNASLEILERTGVRLFDQEALDLIKSGGAKISDGNRVRIPAQMVEAALKTAPSSVTLYDRFGTPTLFLEDEHSYYGTGSDCLNIIDHRTSERRLAELKDVVDGITVCDYLPNIDFVMSMFLPSDVDQMISDRIQMEIMLNTTSKPLVYVVNDVNACIDVVRMAEAVVGGEEAMRNKPLAACYINVTSGLIHNQEATQKLLYLAGKGLPSTYIPGIIAGVTGPITPAGSMAIGNAGALTGLVLSQLKAQGAPFIIPGRGGFALDMKTMLNCYCLPDSIGLAASLARYYNLPTFGLGGCSDSKMVDQQSAAEASLTLITESIGGINLIHDMGYLESGLCGSLAQLVICNEIVSWIKRYLSQIEISQETLAVDLIDSVGPDGQYLDSDHTLNNFQERWYPEVFEHTLYSQWQDEGSMDLAQRAETCVDQILSNHTPVPLPKDISGTLKGIVATSNHEA
jgi:trimethylamine---corrinoid protein Co-methyltransferase